MARTITIYDCARCKAETHVGGQRVDYQVPPGGWAYLIVARKDPANGGDATDWEMLTGTAKVNLCPECTEELLEFIAGNPTGQPNGYFQDMAAILDALAPHLSPAAKVAIDIGDSAYSGVPCTHRPSAATDA